MKLKYGNKQLRRSEISIETRTSSTRQLRRSGITNVPCRSYGAAESCSSYYVAPAELVLPRAVVFGLALLVMFFLSWPSSCALAKEAQPAEDPQIAQRMKSLTEQLRCLVCQNETLADSHAELAEDLRKEIREQMKAGKNDQEIIAFLTQRYGDFVLYKPPVKSTTYLLWFGPFVLLIGGTGVLYRYLKHRRELIEEKPLTDDERKRAEEILRGT